MMNDLIDELSELQKKCHVIQYARQDSYLGNSRTGLSDAYVESSLAHIIR